MYSIAYFVETVSGMSTGVDLQWVKKHPLVETVSEMSTRVDDSQDDITVIVETVSGISTRVDIYSISLSDPR